MQQFKGALRVTARAANTLTPKSLYLHHSFSTVPRICPSLIRSSLSSHPSYRPNTSPILSQTCHRRNLSLGTFLTRAKPAQTPSPAIVANIARIEADANAAPHDVAKQIALFEALVDTKNKAGYDLLVTRWERMCEFVCLFLFHCR